MENKEPEQKPNPPSLKEYMLSKLLTHALKIRATAETAYNMLLGLMNRRKSFTANSSRLRCDLIGH